MERVSVVERLLWRTGTKGERLVGFREVETVRVDGAGHTVKS